MTVRRFGEAIDHALETAMAADDRVIVFGEDVRLLRRELLLRHGPERVRDAPISESAFLGAAVGAAMSGLRPVVEIMLVDFLGVALDGLLNHAARFRAFSGGRWTVPLVVRATCGGGYGDGGQHEQSLWGMLAGIPGLQVVVPSTPADAAGLLLASIETDDPVVFLEHKLLSEQWLDWLGGSPRTQVAFDVPAAGARGEVADPPEPVALGRAALRRQGGDATLISLGVGVHRCLAAADQLAGEGAQVGVLDLRSVAPLDVDAICEQVARTRRTVVVDEDYVRGGLTGEVAAVLAEAHIDAAYARVATQTTIPYARALEDATLPDVTGIVAATRHVLAVQAPPAIPRSAGVPSKHPSDI